jgi:hypothetical protein
MLGLDEVKQLAVEGEDVAADLRGVELAVLAGQGCLDLLADVRAGHDALIRGLRGVVFLVTFAPMRVLEISFCCGEKKLICSRTSA